jgi:hypothetical protein
MYLSTWIYIDAIFSNDIILFLKMPIRRKYFWVFVYIILIYVGFVLLCLCSSKNVFAESVTLRHYSTTRKTKKKQKFWGERAVVSSLGRLLLMAGLHGSSAAWHASAVTVVTAYCLPRTDRYDSTALWKQTSKPWTSYIAGTNEVPTYFLYVSSLLLCGDEPMCPLQQHCAYEIRCK